MSDQILTLVCPDRIGLVAAVSGFLAERDCDIVEAQQFTDISTARFFMRVHFVGEPEEPTPLRAEFASLAERYAMTWRLRDAASRCRTIVMVSKFGHCLNDLMFRWRTGALHADLVAIVSNHTDYESLAESYEIPFHHLPVTPDTKQQQEGRLRALIDSYDVELLVLARYMQVLSDDLCSSLQGRIINIHHSFLPSFKGAQPYKQAHARGVKLIGATAHYVTADLDEGPIIEQEIARVDHSYTPERLAAAGRDVEAYALSRAVQWHAEQRVILNGSTTVVFR